MARRIRALRRLGRVWATVEGRIVVEGEHLPRLGEEVYDSRMRGVGVVSSVLGRVDHFFIEVKPREGIKLADGEHLYIVAEKRSAA